MKVIKEKNYFDMDIILEEDGKYIRFSYGGNMDLYWSIHTKDPNVSKKFIITKENYRLYELFQKLFYDIENINLFDDDYIPLYIENYEEKQIYIEERIKSIEEIKERCRLYNKSNYNELFNQNTRTITWHSDETAWLVSNILTIKEEKDIFVIEFTTQEYIKGYDYDFNSPNYIPIRFRNSGSFYDPFNLIFMRMYNNIKNIDDINDIGHQFLIEEYIYQNTKKLIKK